jgi:hypothetical protein
VIHIVCCFVFLLLCCLFYTSFFYFFIVYSSLILLFFCCLLFIYVNFTYVRTYVRSTHVRVLIYVCICVWVYSYKCVCLHTLCTPNMRGLQIIARLVAQYKSRNCCLTQCNRVRHAMLFVLQKSLLSLAGIHTYVCSYTQYNFHIFTVPFYSRCTTLLWLWLSSDSGANFDLH